MIELTQKEILKILPHRPPFLLIDKIIDIEPGIRGTGLKNFTVNDFFIHAEGQEATSLHQMMMIECMAQTAAVVSRIDKPAEFHGMGMLVGINRFEFIELPLIGDQLRLCIELIKAFGGLYKFMGRVMTGTAEIAEGELTFALS